MRYNQIDKIMVKFGRVFIAGLLPGFCCLLTISISNGETFGKERSATSPYVLTNIQILDSNERTDILVRGVPSLKYISFKALDPLRLVVVLPDVISDTVHPPNVAESTIIRQIKILMAKDHASVSTRIEIGLKRDVAYQIRAVEEGIRIRLQKQDPKQAPTIRKASLPRADNLIAIKPIVRDDETIIQLIGDGSLADHHSFHLTDPDRFVIDLMGVKSGKIKSQLKLKTEMIQTVRIGYHTDKLRVVFDLAETKPIPLVVSDGNKLLVSFKTGADLTEKPNYPD